MSKEVIQKGEINYIDYNSFGGDFDKLSLKIISDLENVGYIVVQNFDVNVKDVEASGESFLKISKLVGTPIPHAGEDTIIWDIKSNPKSGSVIKTYSEHTHEAEMHTDSQYSLYPEDYFGLLTLKKAECGGGVSFLVSLEDLLKELQELDNGEKIIDTLSNTDYPFIIPNVFKKNNNDEPEFNYGPILRKNEIRFRIDTFEKALHYKQVICNEEQIDAYKELKKIVLTSNKIQIFYLNENDLIFINNKTMLHGRGGFKDQNRHLLRIRINKQ